MWICPGCGIRNKPDDKKCMSCGKRQPKAINFRQRNLERRLSPEELAEIRRRVVRRRRIIVVVVLLLVVLVVAYLFAGAELLGLPRPDGWPTLFANSTQAEGGIAPHLVSGIGVANS